MNKSLIIPGIAFILPAICASAQNASARTVQYHAQDIVPI